MKLFASFLWRLSEASGIGLGPLAPWVLGLKIGSKPVATP
jgi:hypothetical protein